MLKYFILVMMLSQVAHADDQAAAQASYLEGAKQVAENIWIGPQPSSSDYDEFAAEEVTVVVNTRTQTEVEQLAFDPNEKAGQFEMKHQLIEIGKGHDYSPAQLSAFNELMQTHAGEKMVLHCRSGNRASQLYAAWLIKQQNQTPAEALKAIQSDATELNDSIKALLGE